MYRFSLRLKPNIMQDIKKLQAELNNGLGSKYTLNEIIEVLLEQSLHLFYQGKKHETP